MFTCYREDKPTIAKWLYIKKAWVPVITCCRDDLYPAFIYENIPNVRWLNLEADGTTVSLEWRPNENFYTEIQVKTGDGEWITLDLAEPGIGTL